MNDIEQENYRRCFNKIKLGNHVSIYLHEHGMSADRKTDILSKHIIVSGIYLWYGRKQALLVETDMPNYGFVRTTPEAVKNYQAPSDTYQISPNFGLLNYYQWIYDTGQFGLIAKVIRGAL